MTDLLDRDLVRVYREAWTGEPGGHEAGLRAVAKAEREAARKAYAEQIEAYVKAMATERARAAYWHAEYAVATNAPRTVIAKEATVASDEALAKLRELGAEP